MRSPLDALQTPPPVNFRRLAGELHSVAKQASFNIAFGTDFRRFSKPKWTSKFDFRALFFDVIFESVLPSKFYQFLKARNQKNSNFPYGKTMIFTKSAFSIKIQKTLKFHSIFGGQSEENSNQNRFKNTLFFSIAFSTFFLGFYFRFGSQK